MKKKCNIRIVLIFLVFILLFNFVSASFSIGNSSHSIKSSYGPGENLEGWINISLEKEPADSLFEDSEGNEIELLDILRENEKEKEIFDYSCETRECSTMYVSSNGEKTKSIGLD